MRPDLHAHRDESESQLGLAGHAEPSPFAGPTMAQSNAFGHLVETIDRVLELQPDPSKRPDRFTAAVVVWTSVHGITSLRIAKPQFPWPPVDVHVDLICAALREYLLA
jgi:hypothetical protein